MEDIKKTIEFANSKDKLELDIKYDELRQAIKERDMFYKIVGIVFLLIFYRSYSIWAYVFRNFGRSLSFCHYSLYDYWIRRDRM